MLMSLERVHVAPHTQGDDVARVLIHRRCTERAQVGGMPERGVRNGVTCLTR